MSRGSAGEALLVGLRGVPAVERLRIAGERVLVGRDPGCELVIADPTVSRRHAYLWVEDGQLVVEDAGSSGGTYVNGVRIERQVVLPGDSLRFGVRAAYSVEIDGASSALGRAALAAGADTFRHLNMLLDVARTLNSTTVLSEVLEVVLQAAVRLVSADQGCVVLRDEQGQRRMAAVYPANLSETSWGEESTLLDRAMAERRTITAEQGTDPDMSAIARGFTSAVATPLLVARRHLGTGGRDSSFAARGEVLGGILLERRGVATSFRSEELAVFESLAADAAVAIDSARLYRESRAKARIEHEMELARTIQRALLQQPPGTDFCDVCALSAAARTVGGDLYHGFLRGDGTMAVAVGDVAGKGVAAALIMAMAQGLLAMLHDLGVPLDELAHALNRSLARFNPGNRFLTLATALIAPDGRAEVLNAGHCPVAVLRRSGELELVPPGGPILGILEGVEWGTSGLRLGRGDALVLYSDGIVESFAPDGGMFGEEGVRRALLARAGLPPRAIAEGLMIAASNHRHGGDPQDDVTILVARYRG